MRIVPDVVVLDVAMPRMSGFEVLQRIRRASDVPVIMLTARGEETDQVHGLELGADDYVVKPFSHLALIARIKVFVSRLRTKIEREGGPRYIESERGLGYRFVQPPE